MKDWRERMGMTQQEAADALGIGYSTVRAIEQGTRECTKTIELACRWLEHEAGLGAAPAAAPPAPADYEPAVTREDIDRIWERLAEYGEMLGELNRGTLPATIRDDIVRRYEHHAQQQQQQQQRIQDRMNAAAALTDDERAEADKARRAIAKARQIAQGEPWE